MQRDEEKRNGTGTATPILDSIDCEARLEEAKCRTVL
jgi:hypothetical protein